MMSAVYVRRDDLKILPESVFRVVLLTNGQGKTPDGWQETGGGMHLGSNQWLIPLARLTKETDDSEI